MKHNPHDRLGITQAVVTPTGEDQSGAAELQRNTLAISAGDGTAGVRLPTLAPRAAMAIFNSGNSGLLVYPPSGGTINAGSANAAVTMASKTAAIFFCLDAGRTAFPTGTPDESGDWAAIFTAA